MLSSSIPSEEVAAWVSLLLGYAPGCEVVASASSVKIIALRTEQSELSASLTAIKYTKVEEYESIFIH